MVVLLTCLGAGCASLRERSAKESTLAPLGPQERAAVDAVVRAGVERCVTIRPAFMTVGSGCVVTSDGWILTAAHVVHGHDMVEVELADGESLHGRVIGLSGGNDFALVKVEAKNLPYFNIASHRPALGDRVVAIGTSTKLVSPNASTGVVIYPQVCIPGETGTYYFDAIFHSAPIFPGDSGGPLVDLSGDLVGLHGGFASESASVAPAATEVMRVLPLGPDRKLRIEAFAGNAGRLPAFPVVWQAHMPRDFDESSDWTMLSVEETLVAVYAPHDADAVHRILVGTRERFLALRKTDGRHDAELVRAMLSDVFRQLENRSKAITGATMPPASAGARN